MSGLTLAECEACKAHMLWALTPSGARQPIDYAPSANGNVLLLQPTGLGELLAVVLTGDTLNRARARGMDLRMPHHATCPNADEFRRARG